MQLIHAVGLTIDSSFTNLSSYTLQLYSDQQLINNWLFQRTLTNSTLLKLTLKFYIWSSTDINRLLFNSPGNSTLIHRLSSKDPPRQFNSQHYLDNTSLFKSISILLCPSTSTIHSPCKTNYFSHISSHTLPFTISPSTLFCPTNTNSNTAEFNLSTSEQTSSNSTPFNTSSIQPVPITLFPIPSIKEQLFHAHSQVPLFPFTLTIQRFSSQSISHRFILTCSISSSIYQRTLDTLPFSLDPTILPFLFTLLFLLQTKVDPTAWISNLF